MNLEKLSQWLIDTDNDFAYISDPISIAYFTGYSMDPHERIFALLAFKDQAPFIFAPELNVEEAKNSAWDGDVYGYLDHQDPWQKIADLVKKHVSNPVAGQIDYQLKLQKGVMHTSFETIVQAGTNAANPHLGPTMNKIEPNELVLFDLGTMHNGYASDSSRTVAYGTPTEKEKEIYEIDREAQQAAIDAAKPGMTAGELDAIARDIITKAGYGEYFIHRLGHGIGMNVHEFPQIMEGNDVVLEEGMCFSIEPGIYIPNVAGVRIEDCGVVTKNGFETFTHTDKELKYIPVKD